MLKLTPYLLLIISSLVFFSCQKEYSIENTQVAGGTAVFTFTGAGAACANAIIAGNYQKGVALTAANKVTVSVEVTTIGTYIISTSIVNGLSFKGIGTFAATGTQIVELIGSGVSLKAGIFNFTPSTTGSCTFSITVLDSNTPAAVFTYDGAPGNCTSALPGGIYTAATAVSSANNIILNVNVVSTGSYAISTPTVNGFSFLGSGSFTTTGSHAVTLIAVGQPITSGAFTFTPTNNGCSFVVTVLPAGGTSNSDIFYEATIDGIYYKQIVTETNGYESGTGTSGVDDVDISSIISPSADTMPAGTTEMDIDKGILHNFLSITPAVFKSFLIPVFTRTLYLQMQMVQGWAGQVQPMFTGAQAMRLLHKQEVCSLL